jgi:hypothetical protein
VNACETCRHFSRHYDTGRWATELIPRDDGSCNRIRLETRPAWLSDWEQDTPRTTFLLVRAAEFGCILHEPKDTK